jgi:hypothetical protein
MRRAATGAFLSQNGCQLNQIGLAGARARLRVNGFEVDHSVACRSTGNDFDGLLRLAASQSPREDRRRFRECAVDDLDGSAVARRGLQVCQERLGRRRVAGELFGPRAFAHSAREPATSCSNNYGMDTRNGAIRLDRLPGLKTAAGGFSPSIRASSLAGNE